MSTQQAPLSLHRLTFVSTLNQDLVADYLIYLRTRHSSRLCTKSLVIKMTHRSLRAFWPHFDGFSRPYRSTFFIKIRLRDDF